MIFTLYDSIDSIIVLELDIHFTLWISLIISDSGIYREYQKDEKSDFIMVLPLGILTSINVWVVICERIF